MNKTFKLSAVAASLLLGGVLVGCGSSSSSPKDLVDSGENATKQVTVVDDYVIGATVFGTGSNDQPSGNILGTDTDNDTDLDDVDVDVNGDGDYNGNLPRALDELDLFAATEIGNGIYEFNTVETGIMLSVGGTVDVNGNGEADEGEPLALNMAATADKDFINPFTTLEVFTDADIEALLGITDTNINTVSDDNATLRRAVAFANGLLAEAQFNAHLYAEITDDSTIDDGGNLPRVAVADYQKVLDNYLADIEGGETLAEALARNTGSGYDALCDEDNVSVINTFIIDELKRYAGEVEAEEEEEETEEEETPSGNLPR